MNPNLVKAYKDAVEILTTTYRDSFAPFGDFLEGQAYNLEYLPDGLAATDGAKIYIGDQFAMLHPYQRAFVLAHELSHILNRHPWRIGDRDPFVWNMAGDYVINYALGDLMPMAMPEGGLYDPRYAGPTTEEVYKKLIKEMEKEEEENDKQQGGTPRPGGSGQGQSGPQNKQQGGTPRPGGSGQGGSQNKQQGGSGQGQQQGRRTQQGGSGQGQSGPQNKQQGGSGQGKQQGKGNQGSTPANVDKTQGGGSRRGQLPTQKGIKGFNGNDVIANDNVEDLDKTFDKLKESIDNYNQRTNGVGVGTSGQRLIDLVYGPSTVSWRVLLRRYLKRFDNYDYTWAPPTTIYLPTGPYGSTETYHLPKLKSPGKLKLVIAIDTSGSISDYEIAAFLNEINSIKSSMTNVTIDGVLLLTTDEVYDILPLKPFPTAKEIAQHIKTGGTDFRPAFNVVKERANDNIDLFIYFTDAEGGFPAQKPRYPVLWLLTQDAPVPWGDKIIFDSFSS